MPDNPPIVDRLALIGFGLIGGSIARAAREYGAARQIVTTARSPQTRKRVVELGLVDQVVEANAEAVKDADLVIVDEGAMAFASDLARNAPDLGNRPKVLLLSKLDAAARTQLCGRGTIALFGPEEGRRLGIIGSETPGTAGGMPCRTRRVPIP